jgi:hypothetical protein
VGDLLKYLIMDSFKVVCVNDRNKPEGFVGTWVEKNKMYTVVDFKRLANHGMQLGYKLEEAPIDEDCPYKFFLSNRFRLADDSDFAQEAFDKLMEEVAEVSYV